MLAVAVIGAQGYSSVHLSHWKKENINADVSSFAWTGTALFFLLYVGAVTALSLVKVRLPEEGNIWKTYWSVLVL